MFKYNMFKKVVTFVFLLSSASFAYAYKLILINDSEDAIIRFYYEGNISGLIDKAWSYDGKIINLEAGGVSEASVGRSDSIGYKRIGSGGVVEINRQFGDWNFRGLNKNDYVIIRFHQGSGYTVIIYKFDKHKKEFTGKKFVCEHKKFLGEKIFWKTIVKSTEDMPRVLKKNYLDGIYQKIGKLKFELISVTINKAIIKEKEDLIKYINDNDLIHSIIGGKIKFTTVNNVLSAAKTLEGESAKLQIEQELDDIGLEE